MAELKATELPYAHHTDCGAGEVIAARSRNLEAAISGDEPIFILIHGYPQTFVSSLRCISGYDADCQIHRSHQFRYLVSLIPDHIPLYIPDLPGYGQSERSSTVSTAESSKRSVGKIILQSLEQVLKQIGTPKQQQPIVLIGHDRGARVSHRLAVDNDHATFKIIGAALLDIVPTITQFESLSHPKVAAGTFHWPFLAAGNGLPEAMISAYGGGKFCRDLITKWGGPAGGGGERWKRVVEGVPEYEKAFDKEGVIHASCEDYRAAAFYDSDEQVADQKEGRKMKVPVLVMFSEKYLGSRYDVGAVWREWVDEKEGTLMHRAIGDDVGHFVTEEAPQEIADTLKEWVGKELKDKVKW